MDYFKFFKDTNGETKKINKKRVIKFSAIIITICMLITICILYLVNLNFRTFFDKYILRKELTENTLATIKIEESTNPNIYAYNKNIAILDKNVLKIYNTSGKEESSLDIIAINPIFASNNRYLAVAEKNGQTIYIISDGNIIWQKDIEGNISNINVNKNGYVSLVVTGTSYKTVVVTLDSKGTELFKTFLNTNVISTDISNDNKFLAIAEANFSGTLIQSNIKILSLEKAKTLPKEAIQYNHKLESNSLVANLKYQDKNKLICLTDNGIYSIQEDNINKILDFNTEKTIFSDINLTNNIINVTQKSSGIFSTETTIKIINVNNNKESVYSFNGSPKAIYANDNVIGINIGSEAIFIGTNGWLIKKYISSQGIKNVVMCNEIAGIIYKNKIELINL